MTTSPAEQPAGLSAVVRSMPKLGREPADNEDSAMVDIAAGRFAVADGASTSARPEVWSRLLVEAFVEQRADPLEPQTLSRLRAQWTVLVTDPALPWYARAKLEQGADAAVVGLSVDPNTLTYLATAVGDSCLFHIRRHGLVTVGPVEHAGDFDRFPELLSSRVDAPPAKPTVLAGTYLPGDTFALTTDAMAQCLLAVLERHHRLPALTEMVRDRERYARRVAQYRWRGLLANDDTTLCVVSTR